MWGYCHSTVRFERSGNAMFENILNGFRLQNNFSCSQIQTSIFITNLIYFYTVFPNICCSDWSGLLALYLSLGPSTLALSFYISTWKYEEPIALMTTENRVFYICHLRVLYKKSLFSPLFFILILWQQNPVRKLMAFGLWNSDMLTVEDWVI